MDVSGIERIFEDVVGDLIGNLPARILRELGMALEEARDLGLRRQVTAGEAFDGVLDDGGDRLIAQDGGAVVLRFLAAVFVAVGKLKAPVTVEAAAPHAAHRLLGILLPVPAGKLGVEHLARVVLGIIGEDAIFGRYDDATCLGDGVAD